MFRKQIVKMDEKNSSDGVTTIGGVTTKVRPYSSYKVAIGHGLLVSRGDVLLFEKGLPVIASGHEIMVSHKSNPNKWVPLENKGNLTRNVQALCTSVFTSESYKEGDLEIKIGKGLITSNNNPIKGEVIIVSLVNDPEPLMNLWLSPEFHGVDDIGY